MTQQLISVNRPIDVYYSAPGYPNEGVQLMPGELARVVNAKCPAVFGPRPYFTLVEFERNGQTYRAAIWPGDEQEQ